MNLELLKVKGKEELTISSICTQLEYPITKAVIIKDAPAEKLRTSSTVLTLIPKDGIRRACRLVNISEISESYWMVVFKQL